jgi:hypothetical protein
MNGETWASLAIQIPLVVAFIWYSRDMQKQFTATLEKRDQMYEQRNNAIVAALTANTAQLTELTRIITAHDARTNGA